MDGSVPHPGRAVTRQRRRMERMLAEASPQTWAAPSRCEGWSVREVIAHLVTVNGFFEASLRAGRDGHPTRMLASFDPAADPGRFVESMGALDASEVFEQFVASNDGFLGIVAELSGDEWDLVGEAPIGHVGLDRILDHALWDAWVHERDIALPLGLPTEEETGSWRPAFATPLRSVRRSAPAERGRSPGPCRWRPLTPRRSSWSRSRRRWWSTRGPVTPMFHACVAARPS